MNVRLGDDTVWRQHKGLLVGARPTVTGKVVLFDATSQPLMFPFITGLMLRLSPSTLASVATEIEVRGFLLSKAQNIITAFFSLGTTAPATAAGVPIHLDNVFAYDNQGGQIGLQITANPVATISAGGIEYVAAGGLTATP